MPRLFLLTTLCAAAALPTGSDVRAGEAARARAVLADEAGLRAAFEASRHAVAAVVGGFEAHNPGQALRTHFDGRGFIVEPDAGGWEWGLELVRYGFAGAERAVTEPARTSAQGARVTYGWDETLDEWYVNDARGLEHGFTLHERPAPQGDGDPGPLTLCLAVRGELCPEVGEDGRSVSFADASGAAVLTYTGLSVLDADGRPLAAGFERVADGLLLSIDELGARYPLTIDPIVQQAYFKASNTERLDAFGWAVSATGDTVVVGAPAEDSRSTGVNGDPLDNSAASAGAAYVFVRRGTSWSQQAYLKASNTQANDQFGRSVSMSGDTIVIGASFEDSGASGVNGDQTNDASPNSGAAYVFVRSGTSWSQQAYLKASNTGSNDEFGEAVSVWGDTIVVGARLEDSDATGVNGDQTNDASPKSGAAYVFVRNGTSWSQQAYLKASNTEFSDTFGAAVAVWGDTIGIGAPQEDGKATGVNGNPGNGLFNSGAAYVFARSGTTWSQEAYVKASNTDLADRFGSSVGLSGATLVVGAYAEDSNSTGVGGPQGNDDAADSGAAYVFFRDGTVWSQQAYLKASNTSANDRFGWSVTSSGSSLVIGAPGEDSGATGVDGDQLNGSAPDAGAAYVFHRQDTSWTQTAYLKASNTGPLDSFGSAAALSLGNAIVSAPQEDSQAQGVNGNQSDDSAADSGAAYGFQLCSTVVYRNAGSNPGSYVAAPPVLGGTFTATVDNNLAGQTASLLFAFDTPTSFPLATGQVLLCVDLGSGELFTGANLYPTTSAGGVDGYSLAIPNVPLLEDAAVFTQALQFGNPPFVLSNAQDLTLGGF